MTEQTPNTSGMEMTPQPSPPLAPRPQSLSPSGYAITAFVLGILSFITCGPCAGIPAFIIGMVELRNIKNRTSTVEGRPFAMAGAILGGISSALAILIILFYIVFILITVLAHGSFGPR
jgi:O-antigen/teichoic acid export membrane protein